MDIHNEQIHELLNNKCIRVLTPEEVKGAMKEPGVVP